MQNVLVTSQQLNWLEHYLLVSLTSPSNLILNPSLSIRAAFFSFRAVFSHHLQPENSKTHK